jgi:hypothetical protein
MRIRPITSALADFHTDPNPVIAGEEARGDRDGVIVTLTAHR